MRFCFIGFDPRDLAVSAGSSGPQSKSPRWGRWRAQRRKNPEPANIRVNTRVLAAHLKAAGYETLMPLTDPTVLTGLSLRFREGRCWGDWRTPNRHLEWGTTCFDSEPVQLVCLGAPAIRYLQLLALWTVIVLPSTSAGQLVIAHRGASADAPENTLSAFRLAWEQGADGIEGDFYLTSDKRIVCFHDKTTERTAPHQPQCNVAKSTFQQLRQLDVGSWKDSRYQGEQIPTLQEVLAIVPRGKKIFVEIKCGPEILPVLQPQLEQSGLAPEQITIICFNEKVVQAAREKMPQYRANWLTGYKQDDATHKWTPTSSTVHTRLKQSLATGLGTQGNADVVDERFAKSILDAGLEFHVWTVNDPAPARRFADLGVHSITTDKPAEIRRILARQAP